MQLFCGIDNVVANLYDLWLKQNLHLKLDN